MAVGPYLSIDTGQAELLGKKNWESSPIAVLLVDHAAAAILAARGAVTYADIKGADAVNIAAVVNIASPAISVVSNKTQWTHAKAIFTSDGSLTGRFVVYLFGDWELVGDTDIVCGYVDLNTDGEANVASINAEFSFTPHANGLFQVGRTAAAT